MKNEQRQSVVVFIYSVMMPTPQHPPPSGAGVTVEPKGGGGEGADA